jgi:hypothetical protein
MTQRRFPLQKGNSLCDIFRIAHKKGKVKEEEATKSEKINKKFIRN